MSSQEYLELSFQGRVLKFETGSDVLKWRAQSLVEKEPDTVAWISQFQEGEVFYDIGANIGTYTILAAVSRGTFVLAFEPEAQNYALLNRNIVLNQLQDRAKAYALAIGAEFKLDVLYLNDLDLGSSCHTFGASKNYNLQERPTAFKQGCLAMSLDQLVASGGLLPPTHIKIDVDGLEHAVVAGADQVFSQPDLQSVLVEINTNIEEHREILGLMEGKGFMVNEEQVNLSLRKEGPFAGTGNVIFHRPQVKLRLSLKDIREINAKSVGVSAVTVAVNHEQAKEQALQAVQQVSVLNDPFPHFAIHDFLPREYYEAMREMYPTKEQMVGIEETGRAVGYHERFLIGFEGPEFSRLTTGQQSFWREFGSWYSGSEFISALVLAFQQQLVAAGLADKLNVFPDMMMVKDIKGYQIGPHTDIPSRLLSTMFYMPLDDGHRDLGTQLYRPKQSGFTCREGKHHPLEDFERAGEIPYLPNTLFAFMRTDNSFHGREVLREDYERDSFLLIVKRQ